MQSTHPFILLIFFINRLNVTYLSIVNVYATLEPCLCSVFTVRVIFCMNSDAICLHVCGV